MRDKFPETFAECCPVETVKGVIQCWGPGTRAVSRSYRGQKDSSAIDGSRQADSVAIRIFQQLSFI